jgi:hypothetical protein
MNIPVEIDCLQFPGTRNISHNPDRLTGRKRAILFQSEGVTHGYSIKEECQKFPKQALSCNWSIIHAPNAHS